MGQLGNVMTDICTTVRDKTGETGLIPTVQIAGKIRTLAGKGEFVDSGGQKYEVEGMSNEWLRRDPTYEKYVSTVPATAVTILDNGDFLVPEHGYITRYSSTGAVISKTLNNAISQGMTIRLLKNGDMIVYDYSRGVQRVREDGTVVYSISGSLNGGEPGINEDAGYLYFAHGGTSSDSVNAFYLKDGSFAGGYTFYSSVVNFYSNKVLSCNGRTYVCHSNGILCMNALPPFDYIWGSNPAKGWVDTVDVINNNVYYNAHAGVGVLDATGEIVKALKPVTDAKTNASTLLRSAAQDSIYVLRWTEQTTDTSNRRFKHEIFKLDLDLNILFRLPISELCADYTRSFRIFENRIFFPADSYVKIYRDNMLKRTIATLKKSGGYSNRVIPTPLAIWRCAA